MMRLVPCFHAHETQRAGNVLSIARSTDLTAAETLALLVSSSLNQAYLGVRLDRRGRH